MRARVEDSIGEVRALRWGQRVRLTPGEEGKRGARDWGCHHKLPSW
jgi:hypothetical protein